MASSPGTQRANLHSHTRSLTRMGLLLALSVVGAHLKLPTPLGSPALDSLPGFFTAMVFGVGQGAIVSALGHLLTALTSGWPLGLPIHAVSMLGMAGSAWLTGYVYQRLGGPLAIVTGVISNALLLPAVLLLFPGIGIAFYLMAVGSLLPAATINLLGAWLLARWWQGRFQG